MRITPKIFISAALCAALLTPALAAAPGSSAQSCILLHADTGTALYEHNADSRMLVASTTKIMTAVVALEKCALSDMVKITAASAGIEGSSMYLKAGEDYTLEQLLYGMMLVSGNDAASAVAIHVAGSVEAFAGLMNRKARELSMDGSHFTNPHGLDEDGHYSTARDMAKLAVCAMSKPDFVRIVSTKSYTVGDRTYVNHNKLLRSCEGCLGLKTGYTKAAGRSLVSCVERDGMRLICVTLGDPNDWDDHAALYDWAFANWRWAPISGMNPLSLPVISGEAERVYVRPSDDARVLMRAGEKPELHCELPRFVFAPVERGDVAGSVTLSVGGVVLGSGDLLYDAAVPLKRGMELTPWERFKRIWAMAGRACGPYYLIGGKE
ncbi:MAG: D-alanyl-D-alanine carboxypeptidase family protein [Oscillospiraceae bacterium]